MVLLRVSLRLLLLFATAWLFAPAADAQFVTSTGLLPQPDLPQPAVATPFVDPTFGVPITRISDARASGLPGVVPTYSKRQAWNADQSLLLLRSGDGTVRLYDGSSYQFVREIDSIGGEDVFWHPTDPSVILYNPANTIYSYDLDTDEAVELFEFEGFDFANTREEGNLSADGRYYAVAASTYDEVVQEVRFRRIVVVDLLTRSVVASRDFPANLQSLDWVSISPTGTYVVVDYATSETGPFQGVEVYDRQLNLLWQRPLGAGHSDLAIDATGTEVLVMDVYDPEANVTYIRKYRLSDGQETTLLGVSAHFDLHISCRNNSRTEWCFVSTFDFVGRLTDSAEDWLPFEDEVFALALDGSGAVQRLAHHHSRRYSPSTPDSDNSVYIAEPHATVSATGDRLVFGSNWRRNVSELESVDAYVVDLRGMIGEQQGFGIRVEVPVLNVRRGDRGTLAVRIERTGGFTGPVTISAPDGSAVKIRITPDSSGPVTTDRFEFSYKIKKKARSGTYQLAFIAQDGEGRLRTAGVTFVVE
jgi:hypothetical protein